MTELTKCPYCGGDVRHEGDQPACDIFDGYDEGDEAIVSTYRCTRCGREIEITDPTESERNGDYADYWNQKEDKV